jgi:hypothetical protein
MYSLLLLSLNKLVISKKWQHYTIKLYIGLYKYSDCLGLNNKMFLLYLFGHKITFPTDQKNNNLALISRKCIWHSRFHSTEKYIRSSWFGSLEKLTFGCLDSALCPDSNIALPSSVDIFLKLGSAQLKITWLNKRRKGPCRKVKWPSSKHKLQIFDMSSIYWLWYAVLETQIHPPLTPGILHCQFFCELSCHLHNFF